MWPRTIVPCNFGDINNAAMLTLNAKMPIPTTASLQAHRVGGKSTIFGGHAPQKEHGKADTLPDALRFSAQLVTALRPTLEAARVKITKLM
jgi:hypothetical protein